MSGNSTRLKRLLEALRKQDGDGQAKLLALQDLAELLSISTEDTLGGYFQLSAFVKELVAILRGDSNGMMVGAGGGGDTEENDVQMMLLACRCLANLMEALPGSAHSVVAAGAVPILCAKLKDIQYIDLAEQTLSTLEKISEEVPSSIVREGGLSALLSYIDFFSFHVQRTAITAAANCCRSLSLESFDRVVEVIPIFKNILGYPDQRVVEQACLAIVRIVDSYRYYPDKLEQLLSKDLIVAIKAIINPDSTTVSASTYTQCLKMLTTAVKASPAVAINLVELDIAHTLYHLLTGVAPPEWKSDEGKQALDSETTAEDNMLVMQNLVQRPNEVAEVLNLVTELLPPLPKDGVFDSLSSSSSSRSKSKVRDPNKEAMIAKRLELVAPDAPPSRKLVVKRYIALLLPTLIDVYAASVSSSVRTKAVNGMLKMVNYCEEDALADILHTVPFAAFISAVLSTRENQAPLMTSALQLVELLLLKMRDAYQYTFRREGVMHEIERLAQRALVSPNKSKRSSPSRTPRGDANAEADASAVPSGIARALLSQPDVDTKKMSPSELQAYDAVTLRARHLSETYGAPDSEPSVRAQAVLERIKALVQHVDSVAHADREAKEALEEIAGLFADEKNPLSSFEMLQSGLVDGMLKFATETGTGPLSPQKRQELLAEAFMPQLNGGNATPAFVTFVKRLQESLSRMEEFEVVVASQGTHDIDSRRSGTSMLGRQLRLRLIAEDADIPRSCTNIVVSIHAIATFESFNSYLRPRILAAQAQAERLSSGLASGSGGGTLSSLLAAFAAAAGAEMDDDDEADETILSSSPPPRRAELSNLDNGASTSTDQRRSSSASRASKDGKDAAPKRRRSSRLSGKGADSLDEPVASSSRAEETPDALTGANDVADEEACAAEESYSRQEAPVHLEVNDEGAEGAKVVAKTPEGTRVATPQPATSTETAGESSSRPPSAPVPKARASYAAAVKAEPTDFHLEFKLGGRDIPLDTTIFGAVHRYETEQPHPSLGSMWYNVYDVKFRKVAGAARPDEDDANALEDRARREGSISANMPASIPADSQQGKILQLLHVLRGVVADYAEDDTDPAKTVAYAASAFVNRKLTAKLNRQLEEPMIVASACLPDWAIDLAQTFPFLFPFDTRYTFLQSTSFGYARLLQKWVGQARPDTSRRDDNLGYLGRLPRQKVRISRDRILESAYKVFELYGSSRASLEVEFFNEVGSGLGPTLEFYALVSKEFARKSLGLWRAGDHTDASGYVHTKAGLFPVPIEDFETEAGKKVLRVFRVLGQFVAKAMMDSRIIDINFSRPFMRLVLEQDMPLTIASVRAVDPDLARSLQHLQDFLTAKDAIASDDSLSSSEREAAIKAIEIDGSSVADLALDFTLPGTEIELKAGGKDETVDIHNLEEYVEAVLDWTLRRGVSTQIDEFKKGFSTVFSVRDLQTFTPVELVMMTASVDEDWSLETLTNSTKADHGFTMDSRPVRDFLSIMSEFTPEERREFLSFITGSPRLPIGGFAALSPPLTIVRKAGGDKELLSCMTCVNYVKLPDYSSREIVRDRLHLAVREGAGGFHLSAFSSRL
ncbi:hypothetical protein RHOSPDRAFT_21293 [Rhodotorula sp. JG-1b]|nr:hypothetical protein RHOSPDRAFT_21293 [Rhodotorula sp. JG-1b]